MRLPFAKLFITSPFSGLQEHAEKVKDCTFAFQNAINCFINRECSRFGQLHETVKDLEHQADDIKRRIRGHLPKGTLLPVDKFQLFMYIKEQDRVLDSVKDALDWISFRPEPGVPEALEKDFNLLVESVLEPIEKLSVMVAEARAYFQNYSEKQREIVKELIRELRQQEHEADQYEAALNKRLFNMDLDGVTVFHLIRLVEIIGNIADHAENAGDMMRAMVAR